MAGNQNLVSIDQAEIKARLQQVLATKDAWKDLLTSSTGDTLTELAATAGTFGVFANERGLQEAFPDTARLDSSIASSMRGLGVRLVRKLPASVPVTLNKPADGLAVVIPAYSVFDANGRKLYNRTAIIFGTSDVTQDVVLYEGYQKVVYPQGTGNPFQVFISAEGGYVVADVDVTVYASGVPIPVVTDGLWHYRAVITGTDPDFIVTVTHAVKDMTTKKGELELDFGNAMYGTMPAPGEPLVIGYVITKGAAGNDVAFSGMDVTAPDFLTVTGVTTGGLTGGADEQPMDVYRRVGPSQFAAFDRAVNEAEYNAVACGYPGVVDAQLWGQRKLAPNNVGYMNAIRVALLTSAPWSNGDKDTYIAWLRVRSMGYMRFFWGTVYPRSYDIDATLYCDSTASFTDVYAKASAALNEFVAPKFGSIGRAVYKSEIYDTLKNSDPAIKYIKLRSPLLDTFTYFQSPTPTFARTAGGTIAAGDVTYHISAVVTLSLVDGESIPASFTYTVPLSSSNVVLSWDAVAGVDKFRIYITRASVTGLLIELPGTATGYTDTGSAPTPMAIPDVDTMHIMYPQCVSMNIQLAYASDRGSGIA